MSDQERKELPEVLKVIECPSCGYMVIPGLGVITNADGHCDSPKRVVTTYRRESEERS